MTFFETIGKIIERYSSFFAQGVVNTLIIAAFSVLLGTILGTLMATMRMGKILPLKWLAVAYIEFIRGTPLMVQLMFIFYGLPMIGVKIPDISWIPNFSRFAAGIVAMSMNSCAYVAEVIRSGIQAAWAALSPIKRRQSDFFLCRKTSGTADSVRLIKRWDGLFSSNCKEEHPE